MIHCRLVYKIDGEIICPHIFKNIDFQKCNCCEHSRVKHVICKVVDSPHIKFVRGDEQPYIDYMNAAGKYAGFGLEHSIEGFRKLIREFDPKKLQDNPIDIERVDTSPRRGEASRLRRDTLLIIKDGLHRYSIMIK